MNGRAITGAYLLRLYVYELTTSHRGDTPTRLGCLRSRQREFSANECDSGTNYLR